MDADTKRYVRHLKIGRTSMISGCLLTSVSQNFNILRTFCGRKYVWLDVIQNTACLCSCRWWTCWIYLVTVNLFSLYLMNFVFHTTFDAVDNILRVHYRSMKCRVSFSQGSVSTLFMWGEHVFHVCVKLFILLTAVQKYKNQMSFSRVMITNALPRFFNDSLYAIYSLTFSSVRYSYN